MRVLLISMPDSVSAADNLVVFPNTGLCSIAGNLTDCDVKVLDLIACRRSITKTVTRHLNEFKPELVGLSAMTFQYGSAKKVAAVIRRWNPEIPIVLGGYHGSLCYKDIGASPDSGLFDFLIRGEGEKAFNQLCRTLKSASPRFDGIDNLSYKKDGEFVHNPIGPLADLHTLQRPDRKARLYNDFSYFGTPFDCVETSRGCVKDCSFCSITKMYGKTFRKFPLDSILSQIDEIQSRGLEGIFFVDDNITLDVSWLKTLCEGIIGEGLNNIQYTMQASIDGLSRDPGLPQLLAKSGLKIVFLGIESGNQNKLDNLNKGYSSAKTATVVRALREKGIATMGGFIVGNPDDRPEDIHNVFKYAKKIGLDHVILQCLTPYPETEIRRQLLEEGLITNKENYDLYNGFIANIRTRYMEPENIAREMVKAGASYYFNPAIIRTSLLWRYAKAPLFNFLPVNFRLIISGRRNRMFRSTHRF